MRRASTSDLPDWNQRDEESVADDAGQGYGTMETQSKTLLRRRVTITEGEFMYPSQKATWSIDNEEPSLGSVSMVVNLLADLSPAGILPLANGVVHCGYVPSIALLVCFALASAYMMYLVSRCMEITGQKSYAKIWIQVIGPRSAWVPPLTVFLVCFGCCLAYACMFGDLFAGCMPGFHLLWADRTRCLILLAVFPLLPLCMMKDLSALAPTSFGALTAVVYTLVVMVFRYKDNSYAPGGQYHEKHVVDKSPHVTTFSLASLSLVNALAVAFLCHYNGCKYYREYIGRTPEKFKQTVGIAFSAVTGLFAVSMLFGYMTFDQSSQAVILNNYSQQDLLINLARLGMGLANVFSFPLMFSGLREQLIELVCFFIPEATSITELVVFQDILSAGMLALVTSVAIIVTDASLVVGLVGATCGAATIYVIPCLLFDRCTIGFETLCTPVERWLVRTIGFSGIFLMVAGAFVTLSM